MADTKIEWTDKVWNPVVGCSVISPGCTNCYAMKMAGRLEAMGSPIYKGHTVKTKAGFVWNGKVAESNWGQMIRPLSWKKPRRIFANSMSDLFHDGLRDETIDRVFAVMALCPQHTFQVLTKRPERMRDYLTARNGMGDASICRAINEIPPQLGNRHGALEMPMTNIWLGVSVEDQTRADERREFMRTIAALGWNTWVSYEPAIGGVDWTGWDFIKWMVSGGESGPGARPSHPDWHRSTRDWCAGNGVAYHFKQWGAWAPGEVIPPEIVGTRQHAHWWNEKWGFGETDMGDPEDGWTDEPDLYRVGKKAAGRLLDGREWSEFPA